MSLTSKNQFQSPVGFTDHALEQDQQLWLGQTSRALLRLFCSAAAAALQMAPAWFTLR